MDVFACVVSADYVNLIVERFTTVHRKFRWSFWHFTRLGLRIYINNGSLLHVLTTTTRHQEQWCRVGAGLGGTSQCFMIGTNAVGGWRAVRVLILLKTNSMHVRHYLFTAPLLDTRATLLRAHWPLSPFGPAWYVAVFLVAWLLLDCFTSTVLIV